MKEPDPRLIQILMNARKRGVTDARILEAIETVRLETFFSGEALEIAYEDAAPPVSEGEVAAPLSLIAQVIMTLELSETHKVLEIGAGAGLMTAFLSAFAGEVHAVEVDPDTAQRTLARLARLKLANVSLYEGDGAGGMPDLAPFDRIICFPALADRPDFLIDQLAPVGVLLATLIRSPRLQHLVAYRKRAASVEAAIICPCQFPPIQRPVND